MKKISLIICLFGIIYSNQAQSIKPLKKTIGKLTLSIDPRMEALSALQVISDYPIILKNGPYSEKIKTYFQAYDHSDAVRLTKEFEKNNFAYDAPVTFMLYLSQPAKLRQRLPYPIELINRAQGEQNLDNYRVALQEFIQQSHFKDFWEQNLDTYQQILEKSGAAAGDIDWISTLEQYYNASQNSYNIIIAPCFRGGYGPRIKAKNGKWDIYSCIGTTASEDQIPYLDRNGLMHYLWHEFSHSYVNPEFEKYEARLNAIQKLYQPLKKVMTQQAYSNWKTCVNEHIVRAVHLRLIDLHVSHTEYLQKLNNELNNGFLYIEPLLQKLTEYEKLKETTPVTFSGFVPRLIDVLDSLANINYQEQLKPIFKGPVNNTFKNDKIAVIYPTNIHDTVVKKNVLRHIEEIYKRFFNSPSNILLSDSAALSKSLADYAIVAYGSVSGNLFLNHYRSVLPFSMNNQELLADQTYTQPGLKIISCQPNPQNKELGMAIYSAFSDQDIIGINNVYHGPDDYVIFLDRNHILKRGDYFNKSTKKWTFKTSK